MKDIVKQILLIFFATGGMQTGLIIIKWLTQDTCMRVPSANTAKRWYLVLAGAAVGGILSWFIFLYIYGVFQQEQASKIAEQKEIIEKQEAKLHVLLEDQEKLNRENKRTLNNSRNQNKNYKSKKI